MVMIPASVFWFIVGFISCFLVILIWSGISAKKQAEKNYEMHREFLNNIDNNEDKQ